MILKHIQLHNWKNSFFELLFPPLCRICNVLLTAQEEKGLCSLCLEEVSYLQPPLCSCCGRTFESFTEKNHLCEICLRNAPSYSLARAVTFYDEPVSFLLHQLKYKFDTTVIPPLLKIAQSFDFSHFYDCDLIVPVPLYPRRLKKRGLNHALVLARLFFPDKKELIRNNILVRKRDTLSQTALNGTARRKNLKAAFSVENTGIIQNCIVCLVDDVYTTGTTVAECSRTLLEAGAAEVRVITMSRVKEIG